MYPTHTLAVPKYHRCFVDSITSVTHDSKLFSLRLPIGSYLNVPTGHHLAIRADVDGKPLCTVCVCVCTYHGRCPTGAGTVVAIAWVCGWDLSPLPVVNECLIQVFPTLLHGIMLHAITGYLMCTIGPYPKFYYLYWQLYYNFHFYHPVWLSLSTIRIV